jgi:hypothetical protein
LRRIASSFGPAAPWRSSKISRGVFINHFSTQRRRERKGAIFFLRESLRPPRLCV